MSFKIYPFYPLHTSSLSVSKFYIPKVCSFDKIIDYINNPQECFVCHQPLNSYLVTSHDLIRKKSNSVTDNIMLLNSLVSELNYLYSNPTYNKIQKKVNYTSNFDQDKKIFSFITCFSDKQRIDFTIDCISNKIYGDPKEVQTLIWDLNIKLIRICDSYKNDHLYFNETNTFLFERKSNSIYKIFLSRESFSIIDNDKLYQIKNDYGLNSSLLLIDGRLIKDVPLFTLYNSSNKDKLINKIKYISLFL